MAKGQMRSNREKKKPKQDKNKKKGAEAPVRRHAQPGQTRHLVHEPIRQEALAGDHRARPQRELAPGVHDFIRLGLSRSPMSALGQKRTHAPQQK